MLSNLKYLVFLITIMGCSFSCGSKKINGSTNKKIEITVTGLDGNGIAEKNISDELLQVKGVKTISFNYLNNQVVVLYDTTQVTQAEIISRMMKLEEGRYKILNVRENKEPLDQPPPVQPEKQEDIHDDVENDELKNSG